MISVKLLENKLFYFCYKYSFIHTIPISHWHQPLSLPIITNIVTYSKERVKEFITQKKVDLANAEMFKVDKHQFDHIIMGKHMQLQFDK